MPDTETSRPAADLLPCPFCKRAPEVRSRATTVAEASPGKQFVAFAVCFGGGYSAHVHIAGYGATEDDARDAAFTAWNTRTPTAPSTNARAAAEEIEKLYRDLAMNEFWSPTGMRWRDLSEGAAAIITKHIPAPAALPEARGRFAKLSNNDKAVIPEGFPAPMEGWALVPREPTQFMLLGGKQMVCEQCEPLVDAVWAMMVGCSEKTSDAAPEAMEYWEQKLSAAPAAPTSPEGWRDIATHDGGTTSVLVSCETDDRRWVAEAHWVPDANAWYLANCDPTDYYDGQCTPTHWRPLPYPPGTPAPAPAAEGGLTDS
jgi:hypothetical protein